MIMIKRMPPNFQDAICANCQAELLYQPEDVKEEETECDPDQNPVMSMIFGKTKFLICPCCKQKIRVSIAPGTGMFGGSGKGG